MDNVYLYNHLIDRRNKISEALANGLEPPSLQNDRYLGEVILKIATHLSYNAKFINYSFKDDMMSDAIENAIRVIDNFDPQKSDKPFSYLTTIMWWAFVRRIKTEAKQQRVKAAMIDEMMVDEMFDSQDHDEEGIAYKTHFIEYLRENNFIGKKITEVCDESDDVVPVGLKEFMVGEDDDEAEQDNTSR